MKTIENKCTGATLIKWRELKDLQPQNLKIPYHTEKIKKSIIELGFANPFDVWVNPKTQEYLIADGHGRKDVLMELIADGFDVPEELPCTFLDNTKIKTQKDAITYLLRVFNVKRNPMDDGILTEWVETMDLSVEDVCFEELDIKFETDDIEAEKIETVEEEAECDFPTLKDGERGNQTLSFTLSAEQTEFIKDKIAQCKKSDDFKYCETFGNENSNGNALYCLLSRI